MINKRYLTWQEVEILVGNIVNDLRDDQAAFDEMLVVARGGLVPAGLISKRLDIRNIITASVLFYSNSTDSHAFLQFPEEACISGRKILIVDDVISTGESLHAMEELVKRAGGIIAGKMAVLAEGDAKDRDDIITLAPLPLFNADGTVKA
mgnify:CR=1 FL=1